MKPNQGLFTSIYYFITTETQITLVAGWLIALNKCLGVRPIGVGKVMRTVSKAVVMNSELFIGIHTLVVLSSRMFMVGPNLYFYCFSFVTIS